MNTPLIKVVTQWHCPNCKLEQAVEGPRVPPGAVASRFHTCPKAGFMSAPMIPLGTKAKITTHEREDYVGKDLVQTDAYGRPVMSITVERDSGLDAVVFAPTASARV